MIFVLLFWLPGAEW